MEKGKKTALFSWLGLNRHSNITDSKLETQQETDVFDKAVTLTSMQDTLVDVSRSSLPHAEEELPFSVIPPSLPCTAVTESSLQNYTTTCCESEIVTRTEPVLKKKTNTVGSTTLMKEEPSYSSRIDVFHKKTSIDDKSLSTRFSSATARLSAPLTNETPSKNFQSVSEERKMVSAFSSNEGIVPRLTAGGVRFFSRLKNSLAKTRNNLGFGFIQLFRGKSIDNALFEALEEKLLIADVGVETTRKIINNLIDHVNRRSLKDTKALYSQLREEMGDILAKVEEPLKVGVKLHLLF